MAKYRVRIEGMTENQKDIIIDSESDQAKRVFRSIVPQMTENQKSLEGTVVDDAETGYKTIYIPLAGREKGKVRYTSELIEEVTEPEVENSNPEVVG
jgi:hypothetical protein